MHSVLTQALLTALGAPRQIHPLYRIWLEDQRRQRASYLATRRHLAEFLVPHRFEGDTHPTNLPRSRLGYGIGLNRSWLWELLGHVRMTPARYRWGAFGNDDPEMVRSGAPEEGSVASAMWHDANLTGVNWTNFFEDRVLEWMLTSPGGLILVDNKPSPDEVVTQRDEIEAGLRPYLRWIPFGSVIDFGYGPSGYDWVKIVELRDTRTHDHDSPDPLAVLNHRFVKLWLEPDGTSKLVRKDADDNTIGDTVDFGRIVDSRGRATLPIVPATFGQHPDIENMGAGLLLGMEDIVIDLFNVATEVREAFRDAAFGMLVHKGPGATTVRDMLASGSRFVTLGDEEMEHSSLERISGESGEVTVGIELLNAGLRSWALSAKRKAAEAVEQAQARSGVSLQAEWELDAKPLLVNIAERLDEIESSVMGIAAQMAGEENGDRPGGVSRDTNFRLEDEAIRIAKVVREVSESLPLPGIVVENAILAATEALDFVDLDEEIEGEGTLREVLAREAEAIGDREQQRATEPPRPTFGLE